MKQTQEIDQLAEKALQQPLILLRLCDKVYELMQEDIRNQRDRFFEKNRRSF